MLPSTPYPNRSTARSPRQPAIATEWWRVPLYDAPTPSDPLLSDLFERSLVAQIDDATRRRLHERARALLHVAWSVAYRADRDKRGHPQVAVRYVVDGAGVSAGVARSALSTAAAMLGAARTNTGHLTVGNDAIAACRRVVDRAIEFGALGPPAIHDDGRDRTTTEGDPFPVDLSRLHGTRGKVSCPCPMHARGDIRPSLLIDVERGRATCMVSRTVFVLDTTTDPTITRRRERASTRDDHGVGDNRYPVRGGNRDATLPRRIPQATRNYDPGGTHASGSLRAYTARRGLIVTSLTRTRSRHRTLDAALRWSDAHRGGPSWEARARRAVAAGEIAASVGGTFAPQVECPDAFWSLERLVPVDWTERTTRTRTWMEPTRWASLGSDLVLIDIDDMQHASTTPDTAAVRRIRRVVRRFKTRGVAGVASIVASSNRGLQVVLRMNGWRSPDMLTEFFAASRGLLHAIGTAIVAAVGRGGAVDESAWSIGRWARRPGWRVRDGEAVRARLWFVAQSQTRAVR